MPESEDRLPFGGDWQRLFLHLAVEDTRFGEAMAPHIEPSYFDNEIAQWVWATIGFYRQKYRISPSWVVLEEAVRRLDPKMRQLYSLGLEQVRLSPTDSMDWVRSTAIEWARRHVFSRAFRATRELYNSGKVDEAYGSLMVQMDRFAEIALDVAPLNETWACNEFPQRYANRWARENYKKKIATGIEPLDELMDGGLETGQLGIWMAYSKIGKTTFLINLGRSAVRQYRNVAHFFFEGTMEQITSRYDSSFSGNLYNAVRKGAMDAEAYRGLQDEYRYFWDRLYIRGMTDNWDHTVPDVWEALERVRRSKGWIPDLLIIDYADLLKGRGDRYASEWDSNAAAYRDLKTLTTKRQGYAIWTAAQAKKPKDAEFDIKPSTLTSADLGGRYEKVKVADFLGSLNATLEERTVHKLMRIWVEVARDSPGGREFKVPIDFDRMRVGGQGLGYVDRQRPAELMPPNPYGRQPVIANLPALPYAS